MIKYLLILSCLLPGAIVSQKVQWAKKVLDYSSQLGIKQYSAQQVLGKPGCMPLGGDNPVCWCPKTQTKKEFIKVSFEKPEKIRQVLIAEAFNAGAVVLVELFDARGSAYPVYKGKSKKDPSEARMLYFEISI